MESEALVAASCEMIKIKVKHLTEKNLNGH